MKTTDKAMVSEARAVHQARVEEAKASLKVLIDMQELLATRIASARYALNNAENDAAKFDAENG